ncbi:MAG: deoxyribodipyrimidine photo-lyase [Rhodobacteraceae bacterium]|nr:deoxyribodipyrimidine photo-lyase [Paracoccaceae bacterium]
MTAPILLWFKRDLRVHDHPALAHAAALGPVLPLYIVEPGYWALPDVSGRHWAFLSETLAALQTELAALGQPLVLRQGDAVEVLERMRRRFGITRMVSHEETGNGWTFARDRRVAGWARAQGVRWEELPQCGVVRRLSSRDGWQGRRDRFMAAAQGTAPAALAPLEIAPGAVPVVPGPGLAPDPCPHRQRGGRTEALALMESFLTERAAGYRRAMSSPLGGERACSRLSPHLALGALSVREVVQATAGRRGALRGASGGWGGALASFDKRLAWRDHFIQKLEDEPALERRCLHPAWEGVRPRDPDAARLAAWAAGETGLPFVDACMRYLRATGWLNFRMRAMLVSVATHHLWLDWRPVGQHLARLFTDYEPGIHWSQCQMQAGTTGINTMRVYNPVKQGLDQDPDGRFIRRWVPELAPVPDAFVHQPWIWPGAGRLAGQRYPAPVVDPEGGGGAARGAWARLRAGPFFAYPAAAVAARHASRKRPPARSGARRRDDGAQLRLDL